MVLMYNLFEQKSF